ncbi:acyl-CoA dehydrogenase [Marinicella meishanensis]|uniref:acyl-CoA dehydrogenase n=1 Tax=Marinicella meishanensis TaxID=2873263 RepID=UPI001CBBE3DB|nr:acyl-CoA dehydrogenase [Marinicella sp. NBU2979]
MPHIYNRRDLAFQLYEVLPTEQLCTATRYQDHAKDVFEQLLDLVEKLAEEKFQPHAALVDAHEPELIDGRVKIISEVKAALDALVEAGIPAAVFDERFGGLQLPHVVGQAVAFILGAANVSTSAYALLSAGAGNLLASYGNEQQQRLFLKPLIEGRYFGTMCLSETQAGSSLADIKTQAMPADDGTYRIVGNKMWISGGEHDMSENIVHLVLAKIPGGEAGVKGISLFIVPKFWVNDDGSLGDRNDVSLAGLNHKMGFRGTVNTVLHFGENGGAKAWLVGEPGNGLTYMFQMMNEARIGVGMGATSLAYTGYLHALAYAKERLQGRDVSAKDPTGPMRPIIEHADVKRMLVQQKAYAEGGLALGLYCAYLVDQRLISLEAGDQTAAQRFTDLLDILTPVAKSWPAEFGLRANDLAIQVHGGYGYTRDYPVERLYRDNRLNPIHEGTKGIQAMDLLGRKVTQNQGASAQALHQVMSETLAEAADCEQAQAWGQELASAAQTLLQTTLTMQQQVAAKGAAAYLANATLYLDAFGHVVVAWMWLRQAIMAEQQLPTANSAAERSFYQGKIDTCRYFYRYELPTIKAPLSLLAKLDSTCLDFAEAGF